jgi:hypothetical protein
MTAAAVVALLTELLRNLPAAIATGAEVIALVNRSYDAFRDALGERTATPEEIDRLVAQIVANSAAIQNT